MRSCHRQIYMLLQEACLHIYVVFNLQVEWKQCIIYW